MLTEETSLQDVNVGLRSNAEGADGMGALSTGWVEAEGQGPPSNPAQKILSFVPGSTVSFSRSSFVSNSAHAGAGVDKDGLAAAAMFSAVGGVAESFSVVPDDDDKEPEQGLSSFIAREALKENETSNLFCLGCFFMSYFAFRSGGIIVLPLASKELLKGELDGALFSPYYQLPLTIWFIMDIILATPNALLMARRGRRVGFAVGAIGALVASLAAYCCLKFLGQSHPKTCFIVLCIVVAVMSMIGMAEFVRYAAAEAVTDLTRRATLVGRVIGFGAIAASGGPLSTTLSAMLAKDGDVIEGYAIFFLFLACFALVAFLAAMGLRMPAPKMALTVSEKVPLMQILRRPAVCQAIGFQILVQFVMVTPMSGAPLAMDNDWVGAEMVQHKQLAISLCVVSHLLGMFLPGFYSGTLVGKFGKMPMMISGVCVEAASLLAFLAGTSEWHFFVGLTLLGIGWNLAFVASTMLLLESHSMEERTRVTSANETLRFTANAIGVLASSYAGTPHTWNVLLLVCLSMLVIAALIMLVMGISMRRAAQEAQ